VVSGHGVKVVGPDGWKRSDDGTTAVLDAPDRNASIRIDVFEKPKATDAQDCLTQLLDKLSGGSPDERDTYSPGVLDGQPSATQVKLTDDHKHRQRRVVGCNGRSYFLIDWVEVNPPGPKPHDKDFTTLLTGIHYIPLDKDK
jgi:hypothetical protein